MTSCSVPAVPSYPDAPADYVQENSANHNCYSYAFGLKQAGIPGDFSRSESDPTMLYGESFDTPIQTPEEIAGFVLRDMECFGKEVRPVNSPAEKKENEYIVAMKTSTKIHPEIGVADFHFAVQLSDGTWADKVGKNVSRWNEIDGTAPTWDSGIYIDYYDTGSIYFAVTR